MFAVLPYGDEWRRRRGPMQKFFDPVHVVQFEEYQRKEVQKLISGFLHTPKDFHSHLRA